MSSSLLRLTDNTVAVVKARFPLPEVTGDRFPLPVNTGRVDGRAFPLAELTARQHGPSTRPVLTVNGNRSPVNSDR